MILIQYLVFNLIIFCAARKIYLDFPEYVKEFA